METPMLNDDELRALGLNRSMLSEPIAVESPPDESALGRGASDVVAALLTLANVVQHPSTARFDDISYPPITDHVSLKKSRVDPQMWGVAGPAGQRLQGVRTPVADPETIREATADGSVVIGKGIVVFDLPHGTYLYDPGDSLIYPVVASEQPPSLEVLTPPVTEWIAADEARWLRDEIHARVAQHDTWPSVVAAGMLSRLPVGFRLERAGSLAQPRQWARRLTFNQVQTIEVLLAAYVDRLVYRLDELSDEMACDDPGWTADLEEACRMRDDIEGVRVLLSEAATAGHADIGDEVTELLTTIDELGTRLVRSLPVRLAIHDERLQHVAILDPGAWWVALARTSSA